MSSFAREAAIRQFLLAATAIPRPLIAYIVEYDWQGTSYLINRSTVQTPGPPPLHSAQVLPLFLY